ncbi:unnamed protein product [Adineta steineri]|uniref:Uncharacterized protein n=2 Tax=Adineta steineri TaxID=433720 RepID=A0A819PYK8_9BILA|nr:unnamed protein product [Adineta steineri]
MHISKDLFYFLNWELISSIDNLYDLTHGDEVIDITIHAKDCCKMLGHYTIPIVQAGQSFTSLKVNLLYPKDIIVDTIKDICVNIKIIRGLEQRIIYSTNIMLPPPYYMDRSVVRIPIYRIWYYDDYFNMAWGDLLTGKQQK